MAGYIATGIKPAVGLAFAPRGDIDLAKVVRRDVPELGITAVSSPSPGTASTTSPPQPPSAAPLTPVDGSKKSGCGCGAGVEPGSMLAILGLGLVVRRRRRT